MQNLRPPIELLLLLLGIIGGICLSQLLRQTRLRFYASYKAPATAPRAPITSQLYTTSAPLPDASRILCLVLSSAPKSLQLRAKHIKRTWGQRCDKLIFIGNQRDKQQLPETVALNLSVGYSHIWGRTRASLQHAAAHYKDFDWLLKLHDDNYVIMENLRHLVAGYSPSSAIYFGNFAQQQQNTTGGGVYLLSKSALQRFNQLGYNNSSICSNRSYGSESLELQRCLRNVNIIAGDSRDELGLERFLYSASYEYALLGNKSRECCSKTAITFRYSNAVDFYVLDYVLYKLHPIGLNRI